MRLIGIIVATCVVLGIAGCASSPPAVVALPPPAQPLVNTPSQGSERPSLVVRQVILPEYLEGYAVVVGRKGQTLLIADEAEWAERPREGVTRVLRDALSQRLGTSRVLIRGERRVGDAELLIEFQRLDPAGSSLALDARWIIVCAARARPAHSERTQLNVPLADATASAVAAATVAALSQFADLLASRRWCTNHGDEHVRSR